MANTIEAVAFTRVNEHYHNYKHHVTTNGVETKRGDLIWKEGNTTYQVPRGFWLRRDIWSEVAPVMGVESRKVRIKKSEFAEKIKDMTVGDAIKDNERVSK